VSRLAPWLLLVAASLANAQAPPPVSCEPSAACALQMTRDTALRNVATSRDQSLLDLSLQALAWSGKFDAIEDAQLRARVGEMAKQVAALSEVDRNYLKQDFAAALAAYGLVDEARAVIAGSGAPKRRDKVRPALACTYARRGDFREAIAAIEAIHDGLAQFDAFESMADCVARTANPELAHAAAKQLPDTPQNADRIARMLALTERQAGHHAAAREAAMSIRDDGWRANTLYQLIGRYQRDANYPESIATARLLRDEASKPGTTNWLQYAMRSLLDDQLNLNAHAEVLSVVDQFPADDRAHAFVVVLRKENDAGVIRGIGTRMSQLTSSEQEGLQLDLLLARVRVGDLKPHDALTLASDPQVFAKELTILARRLGPDQQSLGREVLQAAIAAKGKRPQGFWTDIAWAQARLGFLEEAHQTLDRRIRNAGARGYALIGISAAEAAQGRAEDAARSRTRAVKLIKSDRASADDFSIAFYMMDAEYPEAAQASLLAAIQGTRPSYLYDGLPKELIAILTRRGDFNRAMELAKAISTQYGGTPEPFADVYSAASGTRNMIIRQWIQ